MLLISIKPSIHNNVTGHHYQSNGGLINLPVHIKTAKIRKLFAMSLLELIPQEMAPITSGWLKFICPIKNISKSYTAKVPFLSNSEPPKSSDAIKKNDSHM